MSRTLSAAELQALLVTNSETVSASGFRALGREIAQLISQARVPLGARMPAERELATALGSSRTTVSAAYDLLREHGYLRSRQGAGSWITMPLTAGASRRLHPQLSDALQEPDTIDLAIAALAAPSAALLEAVSRATEALPRYLAGSGYATLGLEVLRAAIADDHAARGLPTSADQILVTSGAQQAIDLVLKTVMDPGDRAVVDNPTYSGALDLLAAAKARVVPVDLAMNDEGAEFDPTGYANNVRQSSPALAYLIADYHNPTGATLDAEARPRVIAACRQAGTALLVDETVAALRIDGPDQPPPVASFDPTGHVITVGSLSKSIWGGLRIGWVRADPQLIQRLAITRARSDMAGPVLDQLIATELLRHHRDLAAARTSALQRQRDALIDALAGAVPSWKVRTPHGGLFLWVELDAAISSALAARAGLFGMRLAPGSRFGADVRLDRWLRVPFSHDVDVLREAAARLAQLRMSVHDAAPQPRGGLELIA
jgi:DNA-binding transcriptional MocR family regulator